MICLLCFESNDEFISIDKDVGKDLNAATLLYKHFRFCFDFEPTEGDLCLKCWQKILTFHEFYMHIETVHEIVNKNKDLVETPHETVKVEIHEPNVRYDQNSDENDWSNHCDGEDFLSTRSTESPERIELESNQLNEKVSNSRNSEKKIKSKTTKRERKKTAKSKAKKSKSYSQFTCKIRMCMEEFETIDALIAHKTTAHRRIQCTHCPDLKLVVDLNKHLRNTHGIMQNSICEHCGQVYMNTRSLQDHIQRKHEVSEPLQCDICKEWFKSRDTIRAHMNYVHVQGPQECTICGKISAIRKALRKHQTIHLESWKDRFKCIICSRGFRDSTKLKEHSYIHSGITDAYFCQFCGQSFRFGSSLSAHRMKYHPAEMAHVKDRLQRKKNLEFKV